MTTVHAEPGATLEPITRGPIQRSQIARFAAATGDFNPIHTDEAFAQKIGFPSIIAHGPLTLAFLDPGPGPQLRARQGAGGHRPVPGADPARRHPPGGGHGHRGGPTGGPSASSGWCGATTTSWPPAPARPRSARGASDARRPAGHRDRAVRGHDRGPLNQYFLAATEEDQPFYLEGKAAPADLPLRPGPARLPRPPGLHGDVVREGRHGQRRLRDRAGRRWWGRRSCAGAGWPT